MHALGVAQHQPGVGGGAHIGAELAGQGAGASVHAPILDVARTVDGDVLPIARPGQPGDAHRALDFRQGAGGTDDIGRLADRRDIDTIMAGALVAGFDRPAQAAGLAVICVAVDAKGFAAGRCGGMGSQGKQWQQGHEHRHQTHGCGFPKSLCCYPRKPHRACICRGF
ncbi:hypothetical protein D3C79_821420 [compost metagenome]